METEKRLSSSRTNFTKIILITSGLIFLYQPLRIFLELRGDISVSIILIYILFLGVSGILIFFGFKLMTLEIKDDILFFKNFLFGKTIVVNIKDVKTYLIKEFSISIIDPLSLNKVTIIRFDQDSKNRSIMTLSPSVFSNNRNLKVLISNLRKSIEKGM